MSQNQTSTGPMNCPKCGVAMNHHAMKIDYTLEDSSDPAFDGALQEVHTCPHCGDVELRTV